jgi:hypothetical protein
MCGAARVWDCQFKEHPQLVCWSEEHDLTEEDTHKIENMSKTM